MKNPGVESTEARNVLPKPRRRRVRRWVKWSSLGCLGVASLLGLLTVGLCLLAANAVPKSFPVVPDPIPPPQRGADLGSGLDGFASPYIGHTGSWDGKGGAMFGASKVPDLNAEVAMGLRWTFMCVYWRALEPDGPVDLTGSLPPAWRSLDEFVKAAHQRKLNILMQAPVVGGNAGGPPKWAGRREPGRSAPQAMAALAEFAGKLARRYCPGGDLARKEGWGMTYGVRAWELDNEPESYRTNWKGQAADYAEFVTLASAAIKQVDPQALILAPAVASGAHAIAWLEGALNAQALAGSTVFQGRGRPYSIGPVTDVVTFHNYEGLNTFFAGEDYPVTRAFQEVRRTFEDWETGAPGFAYARKQEYWHTEGNFDFVGLMSERRRAAWRWQFFTRAFAAGIRKVTVMDAKPLEQTAVRVYLEALPDPFPMHPATDAISIIQGQAHAFRHENGAGSESGRVWVIWAAVDTGDAVVALPVIGETVEVIDIGGRRRNLPAEQGRIEVRLPGDAKMPPPLLVIDRGSSHGGVLSGRGREEHGPNGRSGSLPRHRSCLDGDDLKP